VISRAASTTSRSGRAARRLKTVAPATASRNAARPIQSSRTRSSSISCCVGVQSINSISDALPAPLAVSSGYRRLE
jgi:hypothetical protein